MINIDYIVKKATAQRNMYHAAPAAAQPAIQGKMLSSLLKNEVCKEPHIFRIELINTLNCNAKCAHCSNHYLSEDGKNISEEIIRRTLKEAKEQAVPSIHILGGEPLIDPRIYEHLDKFVRAEMGVTLGTNSILLDEQAIIRLRDLGVAGVCTTIHDATAEGHDTVVGIPGTLDRMLRAQRSASERDLPFSFQTVYSRESMRSGAIGRIIDLCQDLGVSLKFNPIMPVGGAADGAAMLTQLELEQYKKMLLRSSSRSSHCIFEEPEPCPMGNTYVGITPRGDMMPCYFMPLSMGNIKSTSLSEYTSRCQSFPLFRRENIEPGYCVVAESREFFEHILSPLYKDGQRLPIDVWEDTRIADELRNFSV